MASIEDFKQLVEQLSATYDVKTVRSSSPIDPIQKLLQLPTSIQNARQLTLWNDTLTCLASESNLKVLLAKIIYSLLSRKDDKTKMNSQLAANVELLVKVNRALVVFTSDMDLDSSCRIFSARLLILKCLGKSMPLEECRSGHNATALLLQQLHKSHGSTTDHSVHTLTSYCLQYLSATQAAVPSLPLFNELPDGLIDAMHFYIFSISISSPTVIGDLGGDRSRRNSANSRYNTSSESELSDVESSLFNAQRVVARIKCDALNVLQTYAKAQAKLLHPFWQRFLLQGPAPRSQNLLHLVYSDTSPTVRSGATAAIIEMLNGSRPFLAAADDRSSKAAFISFASSLGNIVRNLYEHMFYVLRRSKAFRPSILLNVLKISNTLVDNVTYERLTSGLLSQIAAAVTDQFDASDIQLKTASLGLMSNILHAKPADPELQSIAFSRNNGRDSMIESVLHTLSHDSTAAAVKVEIWKIIGSSFALDDGTMWNAPPIRDILLRDAKSILPAMQSAVASVVEQLCSATLSNGSFGSRYAWWNFFIKQVAPLLREGTVAAKSKLCNAISRISVSEYKALDETSRTKMVELVLQFCQDAQPTVRASACRCLGCLVLLEDVHNDSRKWEILADSLVAHLSDKNVAVRVRASWSLGNIGDVLVGSQVTLLDQQRWLILVTAAIRLCNASDKEGTNGIRALGCLVLVGRAEAFNLDLVRRIIQACAHCVKQGSYKTQWNACHAIGNALRNEAFSHACNHEETIALLNILKESITSSKNFKVRINALTSLCSTRKIPDEALRNCLDCVSNAILGTEDDLQHLTFQEVRYEDPFKKALVDAYVHLQSFSRQTNLTDNLEHVNWFIDMYNARSDVNRA